ncbi:MAG: FAD-dependent oxidoreductase, partial [Thermoplasmata archaeon]|nr:FAD-dependent oxidoreductase [Thermoplasmata archaeon]
QYKEFVGVNGHSMRDNVSPNTNFALLVRIALTEPVENTTDYATSVAELATTIGGGKPLVQRLGDLHRGRRTTWSRLSRNHVVPTLTDVTPGDISMALPHRLVVDIIEALQKLAGVIPGVDSDSTLLYATELKLYAMALEVDRNMMTNIPGLFAAGDGPGLSRDLVNAAATGVLAGRGIPDWLENGA